MRRVEVLVVLAALTLLAASCGDDDDDDDTTRGGSVTTDVTDYLGAPGAAGATVGLADSDLGEILVDAEGRTLYLFTNDDNGESTCYQSCAATWPALEAPDELVAGDGVDDALLGTVERTDGTTQVTYADMPLYYFAADAAAGDTNGQGVGGIWFVVGSDGEAIEE